VALVIPANEDAIPEVLSIVTLNPTTLSFELEVVAMKLCNTIDFGLARQFCDSEAHIPHQVQEVK